MNTLDFKERLSFIIPSYRSYKTIGRAISSILAQTDQAFIEEVIVVDSSDDSATKECLKRITDPLVKVVELPQKTPPAEGRNIGARKALGQILCFIDSDVQLSSDWIGQVIVAWSEGVRVGGGAVVIPEEQNKNLLALGQFYLQFNEFMDTGDKRIVSFLPSCNLFCDRDVFLKAGSFPDLQAAEDVMFCLKAGEYSPVWFVPKARCFHIFREEWISFLKNQELIGKYVMIYRRLYYRLWFYKGLWPIVLLPVFVMIKLIRMISRIVKGGAGHCLRFMVSLPAFIPGMLFWMWGFFQGVLQFDRR
ncbi:MAG: glycosyltransferase [Candidatus Omnitrophica bacterium]|nr:glycosyltransferase [Candidatus Omnitrophota bacterium]